MKPGTLEVWVAELERISRTLQEPFPIDDCRKLIPAIDHADDADAGMLAPDLATYFANIAGYCSWGRCLLGLTETELREAVTQLATDFFTRHPEYQSLQSWINVENTPGLCDELIAHEQARQLLLSLMSHLLAERCERTSSNSCPP